MTQTRNDNHLNLSNKFPILFGKEKNRIVIATFVTGAIIAILGVQVASSESNNSADGTNASSTSNSLENDIQDSLHSLQDQNLPTDSGSSDKVEISENNISISTDSDSQALVNQSDSSISVRIDSNSSSSSSGSSASDKQPSLVINGQDIAIPENGRVNKTIKDEDTKTRLRADVDGNGSSSINISTETNN